MEPSAIARREFFYVGGRYAGPPDKAVMHGQNSQGRRHEAFDARRNRT